MHLFIIAFALVAIATTTIAAPPNQDAQTKTEPATSPQTQVYNQQPGGNQPVENYVPHATYPYADTYPNSGYDTYVTPANGNYGPAGEYMTNLMPTANTALTVALKIFAKVGLFLLGGVALLVVGGVFTTAVCSLTPLCTITFAGMQNIDKDTMRSYVTPDKLSQAAAFVQEAVGKYQRLQRAVGN